MPGINWRENPGVGVTDHATGGGAEGRNWRTQLPPGSRHRIANKVLDTLKKHLPISEEEGLQNLDEIAVRFEESIFNEARSQSDYLRRVSLKMLNIVRESQNLGVNSLLNNAASSSRDSHDPVEAGMEYNDWRIQLRSESRTRIVNKIVETLKRYLPFSGPEGELEIGRIGMRLEERIYSSATSQSDYLRKISLKMLTMETRSQRPRLFISTSDSGNPQNPALLAAFDADDALVG